MNTTGQAAIQDVIVSVSVVSRINDDVTNDPCIAEKRDPPNTPATPII